MRSIMTYFIRLFFFLASISTSFIVKAIPSDCSEIAAPAAYIESNGLVCLQNVVVEDPVGNQLYKATLQWLGEADPNRFLLISSDFDDDLHSYGPVYSIDGLLTLPQIDIPKLYGTERYVAQMVRVPESVEYIFELGSIAVYENPNYVPNRDWKPYGMLFPEERRSIDLLGQSIPYAKLADAVYDFDNDVVDDWELIETIDRSSGMQAGVFQNRNTGDLAIAYRGTEECIFCTDFILDKAADAALVFGIMHDQFRHAYNFASSIRTKYPDRKIIVTGHSLGGGLAQAAGSALNLETYAFNSSPVPNDFFDKYPTVISPEELPNKIFVIADVHDPVSNTDESGDFYLSARHVTSLVQFDFDLKEINPDTVRDLEDLRFNRHSITRFTNNAVNLIGIYQAGW